MKKILLIIIGTISLTAGSIGIFVPILPTTPFLLLALTCYLRSSKKLYDFIIQNKYLGPYVKDYLSGKGIPKKAKKKAVFLIWVMIGFSVFLVRDKIILQVMLVIIAGSVSAYILTRKTPESNI